MSLAKLYMQFHVVAYMLYTRSLREVAGGQSRCHRK